MYDRFQTALVNMIEEEEGLACRGFVKPYLLRSWIRPRKAIFSLLRLKQHCQESHSFAQDLLESVTGCNGPDTSQVGTSLLVHHRGLETPATFVVSIVETMQLLDAGFQCLSQLSS